MTKTNADYVAAYREREAAKAAAMGVVNTTFPLPASVSAMLGEVAKRDGFDSINELVITLIRVAHAGGPVVIPSCNFVPKAKHLAKICKPCDACNDSGEVLDKTLKLIPCKRCSS